MASFCRRVRAALTSRGAKGFVSVISGTLVAQIITFAFLPLLSRLYSPEAFGALSFVTSSATLVTTAATLRLETALMLPRKHKTVQALLNISLISAAIAALITGVIVYFLQKNEPHLTSIPLLPFWVVLTVYLSSLFALLGRLVLRKGKYREIGKRSIVQATVTGLSQVAASPLPIGTLGLIGGHVLGRSAGLVPMYKVTKEFFGRTDLQSMKAAIRQYWRFPLVFAPSSLLNAYGAQAPILFITFWFTVGQAGLLSMAERIIGAPLAMIGNALGQVVESEMSSRLRQRSTNYVRMFVFLSSGLAVIGLVVGGVFSFLGTQITTAVLGQEWEVAGQCVEIMAFTIGLRLLANPTSRVIALFQRSRGMIIIDLLRALLISGSIFSTVFWQLEFLEAVMIFYISLGVVYFATWLYSLRVVIQESRK